MQQEFNRFFEMLRDYAAQNAAAQNDPQAYQALVPSRRTVIVRSTTRRNIKVQNPEND
jgi:hypothetical protein